jgi:hypothetical protein
VIPDEVGEHYGWLEAEIAKNLEADHTAALRTRGARMVPAEAVAYLRAEVERVLSEG